MTSGRHGAPGASEMAPFDPASAPGFLPYARQWIDESDIAAVVEVLRSEFVTQGPAIERFEQALAGTTGARHAVVVSSGTAALHLLAVALGMGPGRTGITSPITFAASANCLLYAGADACFADVDATTGLMSPPALEAEIERLNAKGSPPGVVIAVSLGGLVPDLPLLEMICRKHGWELVEDAAHSLGAVYRKGDETHQSASCAHTRAAILSFHAVKHICTGEGGAVLTNDDALANHIRRLRSHGIERPVPDARPKDAGGWYNQQVELGFHYRMTEMQAALGKSQLTRLPAFLTRRRQLAQNYAEAFGESRFRCVMDAPHYDENSACHLFVVHFRNGELRRRAYDWLAAEGIRSQVHYLPVYRHPHYARSAVYPPLDGAERFHRGCLSLPLFPMMTDADQARVIASLEAFSARMAP
ncbi:MAG TPA: aminotransferase class I/II-fold pyridoxal phosphate-dependent enzyme [Opitutaceae bacterium]